MSKNSGKSDLTFKVRARVLDQLGEQLIKSESIALLELIKNAYDADAETCEVIMENIDQPDTGKITIKDDGSGMSEEILKNVWMEIGTSYKHDKKNSPDKRSNKYHRIPLGEKGIGRFGVHRLGKKIELITSDDGKHETVLEIDWTSIQNSKYIEDIPFIINKRPASEFVSKTGTNIIITQLKGAWDRRTVRSCARSITSLNSPFGKKGSFKASLTLKDENKNWLDGILDFQSIKSKSLFSFDATVRGAYIASFNYQFKPWPSLNKVAGRKVTIKDIKALTALIDSSDKDERPINLNDHRIGEIKIRGIIFDLDSKILSLGVPDKSGLKNYLKENGGVYVFRDNMRVLDYGEQGNDWLGLDSKRINNPAGGLSNNLLIVTVEISSEYSQDLMEKANREGFIENAAFLDFKAAVSHVLGVVEDWRKVDKNILRNFYNTKKAEEPVTESIEELEELVETKITDKELKKSFTKRIARIKNKYENLKENLMKSAGAGLNFIMVLHQIEKIIKSMSSGIKQKSKDINMEEYIDHLTRLVEGYSVLVKKSEIKSRNMEVLIEQSLKNVQFRFDIHQIHLRKNYNDNADKFFGICAEYHVLHALMNIFDNSIWWLGYSQTKNPSIFIDLTDELDGYTTVVIADNGPGFSLPTEELGEPFISAKPGGMGIGLHLTREIMTSLKGRLLFPEAGDFDIPKEYHKGAIIALAFRKENR